MKSKLYLLFFFLLFITVILFDIYNYTGIGWYLWLVLAVIAFFLFPIDNLKRSKSWKR